MGYLYRGTVVGIDEDGRAKVLVPKLSGEHFFGPMDVGGHDIALEDRVLVGTVGDVMEDLVLIAPLRVTRAQIPVYFFEDEASRDVVFPTPTTPLVVWIDDIGELQVWSPDASDWVTISWDEARVAQVESDVTNLFLTALAHDARIDALELFNVTDTTTVDLTFNSTTKELKADVKANSITLNDLAGVTVSSQLAKHTLVVDGAGTSWVNRLLVLDDLGECIITSQTTGQILRFDGGNWVNIKPLLTHLDDVVITSVATGDQLRWNGTDWVNVTEASLMSNANGIAGLAVSSGTDTRNNAAFANLAGTGSVTSFSLTKKYAATRLKVEMHATCFFAGTSVGVRFGVLINAVTTEVARLPPTSVAGVHQMVSGVRYISSVPAGAQTIQGQWATLGGQCTRDTADWLAISAEEVA